MFEISEEQELIVQTVAQFTEEHIWPHAALSDENTHSFKSGVRLSQN